MSPRPRLFRRRSPIFATAEAVENRTLLSAGLTAQYFSSDTGSGLTGLVLGNVATNVDFTSGANSFPSGIPANFSSRYEGSVKPTVTGTYTFYADVNGGDHVYLAPIPTGSAATGQEIINNWATHTTEDASSTVNLASGTTYAIKIEYISYSGTPSAVVQWSAINSSGGSVVSKAPIPQSDFSALDATQGSYSTTAVDTTTRSPGVITGAPSGWMHVGCRSLE